MEGARVIARLVECLQYGVVLPCPFGDPAATCIQKGLQAGCELRAQQAEHRLAAQEAASDFGDWGTRDVGLCAS